MCCKYDMFCHTNKRRQSYHKDPNKLLVHIDDDLLVSLIYPLGMKRNIEIVCESFGKPC